jgi:hypothetical protein
MRITGVTVYDEAVTGSKQIFFFIFFTVERDTTDYRGTIIENVKKSKFNPPYYAVQKQRTFQCTEKIQKIAKIVLMGATRT